jgi:hypothetical protein
VNPPDRRPHAFLEPVIRPRRIEATATVGRVRLYGVAVTDNNCRLLITALIADGSPAALETADRISAELAQRPATTALSPEGRDALLRSMPKHPPSGLMALQRALLNDQRARA